MSLQWKITYTIRDDKYQTAKMVVHLMTKHFSLMDESPEQPDAFAKLLGVYIDDVISGQIVAINLSLSVSLPPEIKKLPETTSDVEEGALMTYRTEDNRSFVHRVPTFNENFITDGFIPALARFIVMMESPLESSGNWYVSPCDSRGMDIAEWKSVKENFKPRRKR